MTFGLVVLTCGRGELLEGTMAALARHLPPFAVTLICDDSGDPSYVRWMRERWPGARYDAHRHLGHGPAMSRAWQSASELPADWLLWMEEDMVLQQDPGLPAVASVLASEPGLLQMVFKRQAHFPTEIEAGGMLDRFGRAAFTDRVTNGLAWMEHRLFYSLNPHLVGRDFLRRHRWPPVPNSEHRFGLGLFRDRAARVGVWGGWRDEPMVLHAGTERVGSGY